MYYQRIMTLLLPAVLATSAIADDGAIPQREVADMLYDLAFANRKTYTTEVVQRLTINEKIITASEFHDEQKALPLPAQMFRFAAEELLDHNDSYWLSLRSLSPINPASGPLTPAEERGLEVVNDDPEQRYYEEEELWGRNSLVAVYADIANVEACVSCHNGHPYSPRSDFSLGDVMGGVIVRLFLPEEQENGAGALGTPASDEGARGSPE